MAEDTNDSSVHIVPSGMRGAIARAEAGVVKNGGSCVVFRAMARLAAQDRWRQP